MKPRKSKFCVKTHDHGRVVLKTQSFWLIQIISPDHTLLPSKSRDLRSSYSKNILFLAFNFHFFHNDERDSIGSSNFSMIWDHSMQLIIEINNWWLEPSVLPPATPCFLVRWVPPATCGPFGDVGDAFSTFRGWLLCYSQPTVIVQWPVTPPGRETTKEASCIPELSFPELSLKKSRTALSPWEHYCGQHGHAV